MYQRPMQIHIDHSPDVDPSSTRDRLERETNRERAKLRRRRNSVWIKAGVEVSKADNVLADLSAVISAAKERGDKDLCWYYYMRAQACKQERAYDAALADYSEAIALNKKIVYFYIDRGNLYIDLKKDAKAERDYAATLKQDIDSESTGDYSRNYIAKKHFGLKRKRKTRGIKIPDIDKAELLKAVNYEWACSDDETVTLRLGARKNPADKDKAKLFYTVETGALLERSAAELILLESLSFPVWRMLERTEKILVTEYKTKAGKTFDQCPVVDTYEALVIKTDARFPSV
jgi:tetratricopeptide (TPR) repeat protein